MKTRRPARDLVIKVDNEKACVFQSKEESWLLVLDNVDDFEDVCDFIPRVRLKRVRALDPRIPWDEIG